MKTHEKVYAFIFLVIVIAAVFVGTAKASCVDQSWVKEQSRTQGGGWIWFPGNGKSNSQAHSTLIAQGTALEYLIEECGEIPMEVKFHEKCIDQKEGQYIVYVRASVTQDQCTAKVKNKNIELARKLNQYRAYKSDRLVDTKICNRYNASDCYLQADKEWRANNVSLASAYAKAACAFGDNYSCGFYGYLQFEMGDVYTAIKYVEMACKNGDKFSCKELHGLKRESHI